MSINEKIIELSELFKPYDIYPSSRYCSQSAVRILQEKYEGSHYFNDLEIFINNQSEDSNRIGADLPWWGRNYFSEEKGIRIFVISQDSLTEDAGSVAFYMPLMEDSTMDSKSVEWFLLENKLEQFASWGISKSFFRGCGLNLDFMYVTDARKVYPENSINDGTKNVLQNEKNRKGEDRAYEFQKIILENNSKESKQLLIEEINFCNPDIIISLGHVGFSYLYKDASLKEILSLNNTIVPILDSRVEVIDEFIAAPFPKMNKSIKNIKGLFYEPYISNATNTIKNTIRKFF